MQKMLPANDGARFIDISFLSLGSLAVAAKAQTAKALPSDVLAANQELDRQFLEEHRLLDTEKIMGLFTSSPDIFD